MNEERERRKGDLHAVGIPSVRRGLSELEIPLSRLSSFAVHA
jgi:hypothetical protein